MNAADWDEYTRLPSPETSPLEGIARLKLAAAERRVLIEVAARQTAEMQQAERQRRVEACRQALLADHPELAPYLDAEAEDSRRDSGGVYILAVRVPEHEPVFIKYWFAEQDSRPWESEGSGKRWYCAACFSPSDEEDDFAKWVRNQGSDDLGEILLAAAEGYASRQLAISQGKERYGRVSERVVRSVKPSPDDAFLAALRTWLFAQFPDA